MMSCESVTQPKRVSRVASHDPAHTGIVHAASGEISVLMQVVVLHVDDGKRRVPRIQIGPVHGLLLQLHQRLVELHALGRGVFLQFLEQGRGLLDEFPAQLG